MRMMMKAQMDTQTANEKIRDGSMPAVLQKVMEMLKPEAAYFYPEDGKRTSFFVFDMEGSWQLPPLFEPLFENLDASIHVTPVMNGEDLERGFKEAGV